VNPDAAIVAEVVQAGRYPDQGTTSRRCPRSRQDDLEALSKV
jgi:hypothetical protein